MGNEVKIPTAEIGRFICDLCIEWRPLNEKIASKSF